MNHFYVITNGQKDPEHIVTDQIRKFLIENGKDCVLEEEGEVPENTECVLVLGGDGTLLQAARKLQEKDVPLLGINLGTLGYLAELDLQAAFDGLGELMAEKTPVIEERMMLTGTVYRDGKAILSDIALNDILVGRNSGFRVIRFKVYVNGAYLNAYAADGMIVATPTGSTAYNLSAGGPVVEPTASLILLTPIAPHTMINRSIVLSDQSVIRLELSEASGRLPADAIVGFDSDNALALQSGDSIEIKKAQRTTKIVKLNQIGFLETLRHKMSAE